MSILTVTNVTHGFGGRQILQDASFRLLKGEHVGLVGANGEGKTTFLDIITGKLTPDEGNVEWCNHITTGYLDQYSSLEKGKTILDILRSAFDSMYQMEQQMLAMYEEMASAEGEALDNLMAEVGEMQEMLEHGGFYALDSKIEEYANGLGLCDIGLQRDVSELSGGQRAKVLLAKLLLENAMILILDEPTNFLDENHIVWLKRFLQNYENAFILVSHDMEFLNDVVNVIYHVERAELTRYTGNYEDFQNFHELKKRQIEQAYKKQQKEIAHLESFVAKNKARAATAAMARSRMKRLEKMDVIEIPKEKPKPTFAFQSARTPGKCVIEAKNLVLGYDEPLTNAIDITVERNKKIAIRGVNGLGKSTLLKTLLKSQPALSGEIEHDQFLEIGYFEQEEADTGKTAMEEVWAAFPSMNNGEVRAALAKCGLTTDHIESKMRVLSGGENAKVRLCKLMLRPMNLLVLDEPTNHLDVDAKSALKEAIRAYRGTLLLVSHEPLFYEDIVDEIWNVENWTTKIV